MSFNVASVGHGHQCCVTKVQEVGKTYIYFFSKEQNESCVILICTRGQSLLLQNNSLERSVDLMQRSIGQAAATVYCFDSILHGKQQPTLLQLKN